MGKHPVWHLLRKRGVSQTWLAKEVLEMDRSQFNRYLNGAEPMPERLYGPIARALRVRVRDIRPTPTENQEGRDVETPVAAA